MRKRSRNYDNDVIELEAKSMSKRRLIQPDCEMLDPDYVNFLQMLKNNREDEYPQSKDYCLDHHSPVNNLNHSDYDDDDDDIVDPDYKFFLDNVKEDGYSFLLQIHKHDGTKVLLKYEQEEDDSYYDDTDKAETLLYQSTQKGKDNNSVLELKDEPVDDDSGRENARLVKISELITSRRFLSDCKPGTMSSADENYLMFLDHVWVQGDYLIYKNGDVVVRYGDDRNDVSRNVDDVNEDDSDSVQILGDESVKVHSKKKLEMKLRNTLSEPFDRKELKEKWKAAKDRKPLERLKVMRGCDKWYPTDKKGKSYLDRHCDLDKLLQSAKPDPERALSLLRCLFFYYENMPHQGSFIPWKNPPTWLHDVICSCRAENEKCPMKYRGSQETCRL